MVVDVDEVMSLVVDVGVVWKSLVDVLMVQEVRTTIEQKRKRNMDIFFIEQEPPISIIYNCIFITNDNTIINVKSILFDILHALFLCF